MASVYEGLELPFQKKPKIPLQFYFPIQSTTNSLQIPTFAERYNYVAINDRFWEVVWYFF